MRLIVASLAATALAAAGLVAAEPAGAASFKVKVGTLGRSGNAVDSTVVLRRIGASGTYEFASGGSRSVPAGTYVVGAYIEEMGDLVLAARTVKIDKNVSFTFDGRKAKKITGAVEEGGAEVSGLHAQIVVGAGDQLGSYTPGFPARSTYAIPSPGGSAGLALQVVLTKAGGTTPYRYDILKRTKGIPDSLRFTAKRSAMARIDMSLRTTEPSQDRFLFLAPIDPDTGERKYGNGAAGDAVYGTKLISYRTPGFIWGTRYSISGSAGRSTLEQNSNFGGPKPPTYQGGKTYRETWGGAVWAPSPGSVRVKTSGGKLTVSKGKLFCPAATGSVRPNVCAPPSSTVIFGLYRDGKKLAEGPSISQAIGKGAKTYELRMTATRRSQAVLSKAVVGRWTFRADGAVNAATHEIGLVRTIAEGLDGRNTAARGSTTRVRLEVSGLKATKTLALEASTDGGKTWKPVATTRSGSVWTAQVRNPSTAGAVSLRAKVKATSGAYSVERVDNAYGVR